MERDNEASVFALREAYHLDVTREARRRVERARESSVPKDGVPLLIGLGNNTHMSDSNRAPLSDIVSSCLWLRRQAVGSHSGNPFVANRLSLYFFNG